MQNRLVKTATYGASRPQVNATDRTGEEPLRRSRAVGSQHCQRLLGQHDVALSASFALANFDDHALAVDVGRGQCDHFGNAQPGGVYWSAPCGS